MASSARFHLAVPVHDLAAARVFYGEVLGCAQGRESDHWIDWDLFGNQFVTHLAPEATGERPTSEVDGHAVPVPHYGVLLDADDFHALAGRVAASGTPFVIEPYLRFAGRPAKRR